MYEAIDSKEFCGMVCTLSFKPSFAFEGALRLVSAINTAYAASCLILNKTNRKLPFNADVVISFEAFLQLGGGWYPNGYYRFQI